MISSYTSQVIVYLLRFCLMQALLA